MAEAQGFWSYVHRDDEADGGRIARLAKDVVSQFEMLTGETIDLFLDTAALKWGEDWRDKIDRTLSSVAFFIPVLTPRYFLSTECRRELSFFARKATQLGLKDLVLPLLYVDVPALHQDSKDDELCALISTFQWEDWRELRFVDLTSEGYRRGIYRIAERLVNANRRAETIVPLPLKTKEAAGDIEADETPGFIDTLAGSEEALPGLVAAMEGIAVQIKEIGKVMSSATADISAPENAEKGFAYRLAVLQHIARQLREPVDTLLGFSQTYSALFHEVDDGVQAIIAAAVTQVNNSPESRAEVCKFFRGVRTLASSSQKSLDQVQGMIDAISGGEKHSRDLRPILRRLRQGLTIVAESREISDLWLARIDAVGLECDEAPVDDPAGPRAG